MRRTKAQVRKYRSVQDSAVFEVESLKTILVGPNEAGKTAILEALQHINPAPGIRKLDPLRDYPRSEYNDISRGVINPSDVKVIEGYFALDDEDKAAIEEEFRQATFVRGRHLDNSTFTRFEDLGPRTTFGGIKKDLTRLAAHVDARVAKPAEGQAAPELPSAQLAAIITEIADGTEVSAELATRLTSWLQTALALIDESNQAEEERYDRLTKAVSYNARRDAARSILDKRVPIFVLFSNYFRVKPLIHLEHLAQRIESNVLDDDYYDYGNKCLLQLLGFTARELSNLGKAQEPRAGDSAALQSYRDQLDKRSYALNAASVRLTDEVRAIWVPDAKKAEAAKLRVNADAQYLKVVVEDELGVEIELDQRSEGFQWLVSFFVVFFAEAADKHANAILLLDEPGLSLHGLKQREFRTTLSRLAESNQTIYTTHSPFLVGPDELDIVRVVEMTNRKVGTKVHTDVIADDPAALLPLQEALGYDLAQSLFSQHRNLVLAGLTDYWYIDAVSQMLRADGVADLSEKIALVPASSAGKVVYYATILHAQKLKVAALLDSDSAGEQAAKQDVLVNALGNKGILRTKDVYEGTVKTPEIEDTLRDTLVAAAKSELGWDVTNTAGSQPGRPIAEIFAAEITDFSKYRLAKAFLRWSRAHESKDLTDVERRQWTKLIGNINAALK
jgi:predicted ATPase